jgi:adenine-specific DNA glycosylase
VTGAVLCVVAAPPPPAARPVSPYATWVSEMMLQQTR